MSDEEIEFDIQMLLELVKKIFNTNTTIHIIPHLNLKSRKTGEHILERDKLVRLLRCICTKYNVQMHDVGKLLEDTSTRDCSLEYFMNDSTHYSNGIETVRKFLTDKIYGKSR